MTYTWKHPPQIRKRRFLATASTVIASAFIGLALAAVGVLAVQMIAEEIRALADPVHFECHVKGC